MKKQKSFTFIDLFSGCGGLSLGLTLAGYQGIFAIEKASDAFTTFQENLLNGPEDFRFAWPNWLPKTPHSIDDVLVTYKKKLTELEGAIDVITGGPPCQGFSFAGRRVESDPRNRLFEKYVEFVKAVKPRALVVENVPGMGVAHSVKHGEGQVADEPQESFYSKLVSALDKAGYVAKGHILDASKFGVPQRRCRIIVVGIRKDIIAHLPGGLPTAFDYIDHCRKEQLQSLQLSEEVSVSDAISDLLADNGHPLLDCMDPASRNRFKMPFYNGPKTRYQQLMHLGSGEGTMDSTRLANHTKPVHDRFKLLLKECPKGKLSKEYRDRFGLLKHRIHLLAPDKPSPTVTTLPDDLLHYSEPRILTVRESARLQSFPDWFKFRGKYTTGGEMRKKDCPRYTQIGNAVPPLLSRAIGAGIALTLKVIEAEAIKGAKALAPPPSKVALAA